MLTGDFNRDRNMDIVVTHAAPSITVLLGNGKGQFTPKETGQSQGPPIVIDRLVGAADINSDGILDLVALSNASGPMKLLGNGDGSFRAPVPLDLGGRLPAVVADFNGDGQADVLSTDSGGFAVHLGRGDGTFHPAGPEAFFPQGDFAILIAADLNGDGKLDAAATTVRNSIEVFVWLGNGDGSFQNVIRAPSPLAGGFKQLAAGDFNGDGKLPIFLARFGINPSSHDLIIKRG